MPANIPLHHPFQKQTKEINLRSLIQSFNKLKLWRKKEIWMCDDVMCVVPNSVIWWTVWCRYFVCATVSHSIMYQLSFYLRFVLSLLSSMKWGTTNMKFSFWHKQKLLLINTPFKCAYDNVNAFTVCKDLREQQTVILHYWKRCYHHRSEWLSNVLHYNMWMPYLYSCHLFVTNINMLNEWKIKQKREIKILNVEYADDEWMKHD